MDMTSQLRTVGKNRMASDLTIVSQMHIRHDPVVIPQTGDTFVLNGSQIECAEFPNGIAITDFQFCQFSSIFFILRYPPQRSKLENVIVLTNRRVSFDNDMRPDPCPCPDSDIRADNRIGTDFH